MTPSTANTNPPAFPSAPVSPEYGDQDDVEPGMRLRDYFAGQVLAGVAGMTFSNSGLESAKDVATHAYHIADAMLEAREN